MDAQTLLDAAFGQASKSAGVAKQSRKVPRERRHMEADRQRIATAASVAEGHICAAVKASQVPLNEFQRGLIETQVDTARMAADVRRMHESLKIIRRLSREFEMKARYADTKTESNAARSAFYGRLSSVVKRLDFSEIGKFARAVKELPRLRDMPTVIICGAPNVGKSTILRGLSGHRVAVASYPFTTKELLVGYLREGHAEMQLIDTPGLLDRPLAKRNKIEQRAVLALQHLSRNILFVLDPSETCGYSLQSQLSLLAEIRREFKPKVLVVSAKKDLGGSAEADLAVNATDPADIAALKAMVLSFFKA
jgi:nucleolar GTP-binding protein